MNVTVRDPSQIDAIADAYTERFAELDPLEATAMGIPGHDAGMTDFSPDGHADRAELDRRTLAELAKATPRDDVDRVTLAAMTDRLTLAVELHEAGELLASLNVIQSPLQVLRDVLDVMPAHTTDDWATIASRVSRVPEAVHGYIDSLREAAGRGLVPAQLQVVEAIKQAGEDVYKRQIEKMGGALAQGRHFRDAGMAGQRLQPAHLHQHLSLIHI